MGWGNITLIREDLNDSRDFEDISGLDVGTLGDLCDEESLLPVCSTLSSETEIDSAVHAALVEGGV